MIICVIIILLCYLFLIGSFIYGFDKVALFDIQQTSIKTTFSIVIPFRNEALNLKALLDSIKQLEYPKDSFEILFVDDYSTDNSCLMIDEQLSSYACKWTILKNIENTLSPKKDAITSAVSNAKHEWIITTDADCILPKNWLKSFDSFIQQHNYFLIAGPVKYKQSKTFLDYFQNLDFISLIGSTIGSFGIKKPFMANGANLAYKKDLFYTLNGFNEDYNIASGDDVFLIQKAAKFSSNSVAYLKSKEAIVTTHSQPNWQALISQRVRWASKSSSYKNWFSIFTGLTVLGMNILIVFLSIMALLIQECRIILLIVYLLKVSFDYILIYKTSRFFNQKLIIFKFVISSILYPFFIIYITFLTTTGGYTWKNRAFDK